MDDMTSVLATVFTLPISVRVMAVNLADIPRRVAWVHLFETFDCVYFQRSCNVTGLESVNLLQEQVGSRFSILTICEISTAFLLINMIKAGRSCAVWSLP